MTFEFVPEPAYLYEVGQTGLTALRIRQDIWLGGHFSGLVTYIAVISASPRYSGKAINLRDTYKIKVSAINLEKIIDFGGVFYRICQCFRAGSSVGRAMD